MTIDPISPSFQGFAAKPTWRQRINQRLGFVFPYDESLLDWRCEEEKSGFAPGAMISCVAVQVSLLDRLRLLITGRFEIEVSTKTDKIVERAESRSRFHVCGFVDRRP